VRDSASGAPWTLAAFGLALAFGAITSLFVLRIPVQLSDSFTEFMEMTSGSLAEIVTSEFQAGPYLRPFRRGLIKLVYDAADGRYQAAFRGFQAAQLLVLLVLVVGALRVRTQQGLMVVPLALALLLGGHTFAGAILEGLPVNHFLTILICCAAAINLARARPSVLTDVAAVMVLIVAMLTIESGLVVAAIYVAAHVVGWRGVSRAGLTAIVLCVAVYMGGRFLWLGGTTPGLDERSAGFGFRVLDTGELMARFGRNPLPFYAYNVVSAVSSVLFSEPRGGVWAFTYGVITLRPEPFRVITVIASVATTGLLVLFASARAGAWLRGRFESDADRWTVLCLTAIGANAVFAFAYEKDAILGPAGLCYALAVAAVAGEVVTGRARVPLPSRLVPILALVVATTWTTRLVGVHFSLQTRDLTVRNEWAYYPEWVERQGFAEPFTPEQAAIGDELRRHAIRGAGNVRLARNRLPFLLFDVTQ